MNKFLTICVVAATMIFGAAHASGKKVTAPTQFQPVGSVVTSESLAAAMRNGANPSIAYVGRAKNGDEQVLVTVTDEQGNTVTVPAVVSNADGVITVTFADGSSTTFNLADFS